MVREKEMQLTVIIVTNIHPTSDCPIAAEERRDDDREGVLSIP